jgi:hypothetical protein
MSSDPIHKFDGVRMSEWIAATPSELTDIGVGIAGIIHDGRYGFGLEGAALVDFVRRSLYTLVERGAKPRHWGKPGDPYRDIPLHYGNDSRREIVEGVIADWLASGGGDSNMEISGSNCLSHLNVDPESGAIR